MRIKGYCILVLLLLNASEVSAQPDSFDSEAASRVFTATELRQAGTVRLSDIFRLLDTWSTSFLDEYTWHAAPAASAPDAQWKVLINEQLYAAGTLGLQNINTLPIHLAQVDSVVVTRRPVAVSGLVASAGLLHFYVSPPPEGASYQMSLAAGNEVGDAGPYRFTRFKTVNIDRIGPAYFGEASYARSNWYARLSLKGDKHHATDARIRDRISRHYDWSDEPPRRILLAPRLTAGYEGRYGRHALQVSHTRFFDFYLPLPLGHEVPTLYEHSLLGLNGHLRRSRIRPRLSYRLSYAAHRLGPRQNRNDLRFGWQQYHLRGNMEMQGGLLPPSTAIGMTLNSYRSRTRYNLAHPTLLAGSAYGRIDMQLAPEWQQRIQAFIHRAEGKWGGSALTSLRLSLTPRHALDLSLSWLHRPFVQQNDLWYWIQQGYAFFSENGAHLMLPPGFSTPDLLGADATWQLRLSPVFRAAFESTFRLFHGLNLPAQEIGYEADYEGLVPMTTVRSGITGRALQGGVRLQWHTLPPLEQRLAYTYLHPLSSSPAFEDAFASRSRHRLSYTVHYTPVPRFSLYGRLAYRAPTRWPSFEQTALESDGRYPATLPSHWLLDLTLQKHLWHDHLQARLSLRNVLNDSVRLHPAGARSSLILFVSLTARFD